MKYTIEITPYMLKVIEEGLINLPYKVVLPVITEINKQLQAPVEKEKDDN